MSRYQLRTFSRRFKIFSTARSLNDTGAKPGGQLKALLRAGVHGVDLPLVDLDRNAAERRHGIEDQHRAGIAHGGGDFLDRLPRAGRRLRHHDGHDLRLHARERFLHFGNRKHLAPRPLDLRHFAAGPLGHVGQPPAEHAVDAHQHALARLDQIEHRRFLPGRARAADRHRHAVLRAKHFAQHRLQLVHDPQIIRVQMPHGRPRECGQHTRMNVARPRTKQRANRRRDWQVVWKSWEFRFSRVARDARVCWRAAKPQAAGVIHRDISITAATPSPVR